MARSAKRGPQVSDQSQGPGWWQASDAKWYPPETHPSRAIVPTAPPPPAPVFDAVDPAPTPTKSAAIRRWAPWLAGAVVVVLGLVAITALVGDDKDEDPETATTPLQDAGEDPDENGGNASENNAEESTPDDASSAPADTRNVSGGTRDAPWAFGTATAVTFDTFGDADGSVWNVNVGTPEDMTADVLAANEFNDAPPEGVVFVGFPVDMTLIEADKVPLSPGFNFTWELLGGSTAAVYDRTTIEDLFGCGVLPGEFNDFSEVFVGGTLTGTVCLPLPVEDIADPTTQVALNFSGSDRVIFGADGVEGSPDTPPDLDDTIATGSGAGTRQAPYPFEAATSVTFETFGDADGSVWEVAVGTPEDITADVLGANDFNDPPPDGVMYVGFAVDMTLIEADKVPLSPGFNVTWELLGGSTQAVYTIGTIANLFGCGVVPNEFDSYSEVFPSGNLTGTVCVLLPVEDFGAPGTQVAMNFADGDRIVFGE